MPIKSQCCPVDADAESRLSATSGTFFRKYKNPHYSMISIRTGHVSITGNYRDNNEDNYVIDDSQRYFIVADGMGGQNAGEKASAIAVDVIPKQLEELLNFDGCQKDDAVAAIDRSVEQANSEIMALSELDPSTRNMGTTVVFLVRSGDNFYVGGVGDSRVYLLRAGDLSSWGHGR